MSVVKETFYLNALEKSHEAKTIITCSHLRIARKL